MPAYPATYQAEDAAALQPIAALANGNVSAIPFIPGGWTIITPLADSYSGTQAFLLTNSLPSNPDQQFAVLAMGQRWTGLLSLYFSGDMKGFALTTLGASLAPPPSNAALFCDAFQKQYTNCAEPAIFKILNEAGFATQVAGLPLIVVGQGLGGPLAQLAAMAFRQSRSGIPANLHTAACYTFSTPPMGDSNFATLFTQTIPAAFNVSAAEVDFFANPPQPLSGALPAGVPKALPAKIPTLSILNNQAVDDPWRERSGAYYTQLLGGAASGATTPGNVLAPPQGYSGDLAANLTQLIAVAYQQTQHPGAQPSPIPAYSLDSFITTPSGTRWGAIFLDNANKRVLVVFRGELSFEESVKALTQIGLVYPTYLPNGCSVAPGMDQIYAAVRPAFRASVTSGLGKVGGTAIVMAGHGVGGSLANIAALDFATQAGGITAPVAIYTFGAPPSGDPNFQTAFSSQFTGSAISSFQLSRNGDPFPGLPAVSGGPNTVGATLNLTGGTPYDDFINHSLTSYIVLLKAQ
jgi:Lipase (class 3)